MLSRTSCSSSGVSSSVDEIWNSDVVSRYLLQILSACSRRLSSPTSCSCSSSSRKSSTWWYPEPLPPSSSSVSVDSQRSRYGSILLSLTISLSVNGTWPCSRWNDSVGSPSSCRFFFLSSPRLPSAGAAAAALGCPLPAEARGPRVHCSRLPRKSLRSLELTGNGYDRSPRPAPPVVGPLPAAALAPALMSLTPTALKEDGRVAGAAAAAAADEDRAAVEAAEEAEGAGLPSSPKSHASRLTLPIARMPRPKEKAPGSSHRVVDAEQQSEGGGERAGARAGAGAGARRPLPSSSRP